MADKAQQGAAKQHKAQHSAKGNATGSKTYAGKHTTTAKGLRILGSGQW